MVFYYFFQKLLFTENYFLIAVINLATQGPLYTCLVLLEMHWYVLIICLNKMYWNVLGFLFREEWPPCLVRPLCNKTFVSVKIMPYRVNFLALCLPHYFCLSSLLLYEQNIWRCCKCQKIRKLYNNIRTLFLTSAGMQWKIFGRWMS